jgi:hypothetical protein
MAELLVIASGRRTESEMKVIPPPLKDPASDKACLGFAIARLQTRLGESTDAFLVFPLQIISRPSEKASPSGRFRVTERLSLAQEAKMLARKHKKTFQFFS